MSNAYQNPYVVAADAAPIERTQFLRRTYMHLAGAILAFIGIEAALIGSGLAMSLTNLMVGTQYSWLIVLGLFMGASWLAQSWANSATSKAMQYAGLGLYVIAQAIIIAPLLTYAVIYLQDPQLVLTAGLITMGLFIGLTAVVVTTKADFSWMGGILSIGGFVALGFIVASIVFGFNLGTFFAAVMVLFAGGTILYQTSTIFRSYATTQYVAAALALFASVALLFFYVLRILIGSRR